MAAKDFRNDATAFWRAQGGAATVWSIFWSVMFLIIAGLVIDTASAYRMKRVLQVTADASALAGAMAHNDPEVYETYAGQPADSATATARGEEVAISVAGRMMGPRNGTVLTESDVRFGSWSDQIGFTEGWGNHVQVITRRDRINDNSLPTMLLDAFGGLRAWDIATRAVAGPNEPPCARDGIITADVVDMQSNNHMTNGICVHGEGGIELNQNNVFDPGVHISMPSPDLLVTPGGNVGNNSGLQEALVWASMEPTVARNIDSYLTEFRDIASRVQPDYIAGNPDAEVIALNENQFDPENLLPGRVYDITCTGGNMTLNLRGRSDGQASRGDRPTNIVFTAKGGNGGGNGGGGNGGGNGGGSGGLTVIENVVIVTNCDIRLSQDTVVRDAIIATSSTDDRSVTGSAGVKIGDPDDCAPGGGAQILTAGGMHFAAKMEFHGSQLASKGPIHLAAQVDGLSGTSIQSLGRVDLASNNKLGLCQGEADEVLKLPDGYRRVN
ncbi:TadE/TadG family type IV pilus assembly protein [Halovulum marinum]|uniref:TadE/TadG family type IV pilus assembly protein n=1 Tax=Halovulum marinum TaxID=2662447 RepID=UPI002D76F060|nr:pilus assembly protein TadG-related protein [Halovulum marinum]